MAIQRICKHCNEEFTAKTTVTQYCSLRCAQRAYKVRKREEKKERSEKETLSIRLKPTTGIETKEILSVSEGAMLLGCSKRTVYRLIANGSLKAFNLGQRMTRIKRSEIDKLTT